MGIFSFLTREKKEQLDQGLEKTKSSVFSKLTKAIAGRSTVDDSFLDDLEEILVTSDVGVETTLKIIDRLQRRVAREKYLNTKELNSILQEEVIALLEENRSDETIGFELPLNSRPYVVMVVGVNGVGKTTTIGKLAWNYRQAGHTVLLGAADTFRAAAISQLEIWAERAGVPVVSHKMGSDPAAVAYETVQKAVSTGVDVAIIDTAGRLHNKINLMNELSKVKRVMQKVIPAAPHEVLLVLDASTGQNAFEQARQFIASTEVTGLALTKLDGTAKGGVVIGISDQFRIPVKYIGIGEKIDQLQPFDRRAFVESLFSNT